jgi:hypothetical protein
MAADAPLVKVRCKVNTTDSAYNYYRQDQIYTVPLDHPCMQHFELLEEVKPKDAEEQAREEPPQPVGPMPVKPAARRASVRK